MLCPPPPLFGFSPSFSVFNPATHPRGQIGVFCRDCLHFPINWNPFQEKLIWLSQTSMHPAFTCAVPCLRSAGGIWPACLVGLDQSEQRAGAVACSLESCCSAPEPPATCFRFCCFFVCFLFLLFSQIGGFLAAPTRPGNHDTSSSQPPREPVQHDGCCLTITVQ